MDESTLFKKIEAARIKFDLKDGSLYHHYSNREKIYQLITIAIDESTHELLVVYRALYGSNIVWVRKLTVFTEMVNFGDNLVPRFSKIIV